MASPTQAELLALSLSSQNMTTAAEEQTQFKFLSLAPTTSASYPTTPLMRSSAAKSPLQAPANSTFSTAAAVQVAPGVPAEVVDAELLKIRRSSSLSSDGNAVAAKTRFLKLGPVHFGEGDGKGDWSEEVLAE